MTVTPIGSHSLEARASETDSGHRPATLDGVLTALVQQGGSDLHVTVGVPPCWRKDGALVPVPGWDRLLPEDAETLIREVLTEENWAHFSRDNELDVSYSIPGV